MAAAAAAKTKKMMKAMKAMKKAMKAATTMKSTAMKARDDAAKTKNMMETKKMMKTKKTTKAKKEEEADAAKIALKEAMKSRDSPNDPLERFGWPRLVVYWMYGVHTKMPTARCTAL